jgi:hypothetical protein
MTPQEAQLVDDLFDRLAKLESAPRDPAAERLIADGMQRAPHAVYALVQTTLVQDEALKRANARIEELQAQKTPGPAEEQRPASFLDTMREALTGRPTTRGSVPTVRPATSDTASQNSQSQGSANFQPQGGQARQAYAPPTPPPGYPGSVPFGSGGSFLGTAASTAAGVIGGSLLLDGIRSMFGHHIGGYAPSSLGGFGADPASPWSSAGERGAGSSNLARELGADRIGPQASDPGKAQSDDPQSAADTDDVQSAADTDNIQSVADTDDGYDTDDGSDVSDDDFDPGDPESDSYDV